MTIDTNKAKRALALLEQAKQEQSQRLQKAVETKALLQESFDKTVLSQSKCSR